MAIAAEGEPQIRKGRLAPPATGKLGRAIETVLGLVLIAIVLINVGNAAGRYLFRFSVTGTDEIMVFGMIFIVVAGAVLALARRTHIAIDLVPTYASARTRLAVYLVHDVVTFAATAYATYASYSFVSRIAALGTKSMTLGIPMIVPHGALLAGFAAMALVSLVYFVRDGIAFADAVRRPNPGGGAS